MLGVGAAVIMLIAHLVSTRDGVVEEAEARFARAIERVLMVGLFLIVSSGVAITALHSTTGEAHIVFAPAFIFKWLLVGVVSLPLIMGHKHPFPPLAFEGFVGGTWLALFMLHVVAPVATWFDLLLLYAIWMTVFFILWSVLARLLHARNFTAVKKLPAPVSALKPLVSSIFAAVPKPKSAPLPAVQSTVVRAPAPAPTPKPLVVAAPQKPASLPAPAKPPPAPVPTKPLGHSQTGGAALAVPAKPPIKPAPQKPVEKVAEPEYPPLPAIRVMPRTVEDIQAQDRASVVQFG